MKYLVTGGAGFIGSHLVDALLADINTTEVRIIDDFSSGKIEHLYQHGANVADGRLKIHKFDLVQPNPATHVCFKDIDCVFHLSANPDARLGIENTHLDLEQEVLATYNVLDAMRRAGCKKIIFSSSGTVYGDIGTTPAKEGMGERHPISLYGAGKVSSEAFIAAYCGTFGFSSVIFRFGNVVGERTTHGCIFDFMAKIKKHPDKLVVLGNGKQSKPYIYVRDIAAGLIHGLTMLTGGGMGPGSCFPFNLAPSGATTVQFIAEELVRQMGLEGKIEIVYGESESGWAGDVPHSRMDASNLELYGFKPSLTSDGAVMRAIYEILNYKQPEPPKE